MNTRKSQAVRKGTYVVVGYDPGFGELSFTTPDMAHHRARDLSSKKRDTSILAVYVPASRLKDNRVLGEYYNGMRIDQIQDGHNDG